MRGAAVVAVAADADASLLLLLPPPPRVASSSSSSSAASARHSSELGSVDSTEGSGAASAFQSTPPSRGRRGEGALVSLPPSPSPAAAARTLASAAPALRRSASDCTAPCVAYTSEYVNPTAESSTPAGSRLLRTRRPPRP